MFLRARFSRVVFSRGCSSQKSFGWMVAIDEFQAAYLDPSVVPYSEGRVPADDFETLLGLLHRDADALSDQPGIRVRGNVRRAQPCTGVLRQGHSSSTRGACCMGQQECRATRPSRFGATSASLNTFGARSGGAWIVWAPRRFGGITSPPPRRPGLGRDCGRPRLCAAVLLSTPLAAA